MVRVAAENLLKARLVFCDRDPAVLDALRAQFAEIPDAEVRSGSVLESGCDACICPGNSFGFMDSGLALSISEALGWELQDAIRDKIRDRCDGELLVGRAVVVPTGKTPRFLVYAPTRRTSGKAEGTLNAYLSMRGALLAVRDHLRDDPSAAIGSVAIPALCTDGDLPGEGALHPLICARQIRYACEQALGVRGFGDKNLSQLARRELKLKSMPQGD